MKLMIIDDDKVFLERLSEVLKANDFQVAGAFNSSIEAFEKVEEIYPDVVLIDVEMLDVDGIEATRRIKEKYSDITVVMLTDSQNDKHIFEAIIAGASGYLLKGMETKKFLDMLNGISQGELPFSPGIASKILAKFALNEKKLELIQKAQKELLTLLTKRQLEIIRLVVQGYTYRDIGNRLSVTEAAIKYHMKEIESRLHLDNRSQVVAFAVESGLIMAANDN